ncbi:MAG TPA: lysylphosphatidylglycerol synthase transmembrane domain-containing protein [Terriglobales bacterium]|nr:lysylphosphatidylglycerol synthase transmembrane domain-containing protein [Terriglobales bacterium]
MNRTRILLTLAVGAVLAVLVYFQFRAWKEFDWALMFAQVRRTDPLRLLAAVVLIYSVYFLRALRWMILLRPVRAVPARRLLAPTLIGFTGLALLGRPGELIRPYLIARKEGLTLSSQIAVWAVERIFDVGAVAACLALVVFSGALASIPFFQRYPGALRHLHQLAYLLVAGVLAGALLAMLARRHGTSLAAALEKRFAPLSPRVAHHVAHRVQAFGEGLNTIHDLRSFLEITGLSLLIWVAIALAYVQVTHAYAELADITVAHVVLLMVSSMTGSLLQLPAVGGGSQLAIIKVLEVVFAVKPELAVGCGIMLWLVTFMSVVPTGLLLAHREHVSLRKAEAESHVED